MKTNQVLIRKMGQFNVEQRTSDAMFNATELLKQWNKTSGQQKQIVHYFDQTSTKEFIVALCDEYSIDSEDFSKERHSVKNSLSGVYAKSRGINGGTWMEPLLFIDFAMWLNPTFKVKVLRFVYDELIKYRNDAGDSYQEMTSALKMINDDEDLRDSIKHVAKAMNFVVYNEHFPEIRNKMADENKLKELSELERNISSVIKCGLIKSQQKLIAYLRDTWKVKHTPKVFTN